MTASGVAAACPDPTLDAPRYEVSGPAALAPQSWSVQMTGDQPAPCPDWQFQGVMTEDVRGFLPLAPTAIFDLTGMAPHILMVRAEGRCDPVMVLRQPDGRWYFGTQAAEREEVTLWNAPDGPLMIWVGSRSGDSCQGQVILETFDR